MGAKLKPRALRLVHPHDPTPLDHLHEVLRFYTEGGQRRVYVEIKDVPADDYETVRVGETCFDQGHFRFKRLVISDDPEIHIDLFPAEQ